MDHDRDLSDLGVRYDGDPDAEPVDLAELLAPEPDPEPPASRAVKDAARAQLARELGRGPVRVPPSSPCQCGALAGEWCRRAGRSVWGFEHPSRVEHLPV